MQPEGEPPHRNFDRPRPENLARLDGGRVDDVKRDAGQHFPSGSKPCIMAQHHNPAGAARDGSGAEGEPGQTMPTCRC